MKLEVAIAAVMATEALSCEFFSLEFNSRDLSENEGNRMKMIEVISQLNAGSGRKNPAFQKLRQQRQQRFSDSVIQGSHGKGVSDADNLDIGILGSVSTNGETDGNDFNEEYRRLDEDVDVCPSTEELRDYFRQMHAYPYAVRFGSLCESLFEYFGQDACTTCEFPKVVDPETGLATGLYDMKIDCPGLIDVVNCTCIYPLEPMCSEDSICPDCGPICESCNVDFDRWFVDHENCIMTNETRMANEDDGGMPFEVEEAVDHIMYEMELVPAFFPECEGWVGDFEKEVMDVVETDASGEESVEVPVVAESEGDTEEKDTAAATSASGMYSTPVSTILRFVLVGASLFWIAA